MLFKIFSKFFVGDAQRGKTMAATTIVSQFLWIKYTEELSRSSSLRCNSLSNLSLHLLSVVATLFGLFISLWLRVRFILVLHSFCFVFAFGSSLLLFCEFRFWQLHKMKQMRNKFRSSSFSLSVILLDGRSLCASLFLLFCCKCSVEKCLQRVLNAIFYWCCFSVAVLICRAQKELQKINKIL